MDDLRSIQHGIYSEVEYYARKIVGQKYIDEFNHPRHLSIVMFGINLFPYKIEDYREMAELII